MQNKIVIPGMPRIKRKSPLNPKVGISQDHYAWLCELADETGKTCSYLNNLFYDFIRNNAEIEIERREEEKRAYEHG